MIFLNTKWNDFFLNDNNFIENKNIKNSLILNETNIYINFCFFLNLISSITHGGVISIINNNLNNLLIEQSVFSHCKILNNYDGGAIYIQSINSNIIFSKICGNNCTSVNKNYQFSYTKSSTNGIHNFEYLTCFQNSLNYEGLNYICLLELGNILTKNNNFSKNYVFSVSSISYYNSKSIYSIFNNLNNNFASDCVVYHFWDLLSENNSILNHNFINNSLILRLGLIHIHNGNIKLYFCNFNNNLGRLFSIYSYGKLYLFECFIIDLTYILNEGGQISYTNIYNLNSNFIINNFNCQIKNQSSQVKFQFQFFFLIKLILFFYH